MKNPAFEFLRQFKQVTEVTEELVTKTLKRKYPDLTLEELLDMFEQGICGEFGKVYNIDPQTLLGWAYEYMSKKENPVKYLDEPLLDNRLKITDKGYPTTHTMWEREVNKCYNAYLKGIDATNFHPHIYDRLVMDGKIERDYFNKHLVGENIREAKHKSLADYFDYMRQIGNDKIYYV